MTPLLAVLLVGSESFRHSVSSAGIVTAASVVQSLGAALGRRVEIPAKLGKEMLYIEAGTATPEVRLKALASALHASLIYERDSYRILRTASDLRAIHDGRTAERKSWMRIGLQRAAQFRSARLGSGPTANNLQQEIEREAKSYDDLLQRRTRLPHDYFGMADLLPCQLLLEGCAQRLGPTALAEVPTGESRVFESEPTQTALKLPDVSDLIEHYRVTMAQLGQLGIPETALRLASERAMALGLTSCMTGAFAGPLLTRLVSSSTPRGIGVELELYGMSGNLVDSASIPLSELEPLVSSLQAEDKLKSRDSIRISVGDDAQNAAHFFQQLGGKLGDMYSHPDQSEPLDFFVKAAVSWLVHDSLAKCVVADVPDDFADIAARCVNKGVLNCTAFLWNLKYSEGFEKVEVAGASVWRPTDPEYVEAHRTDRVALGKYARLLARADGESKVRLQARLCHEGFPGEWAFGGWWLHAYEDATHTRPPMSNITLSMYRLLGGVSDGLWDRLEAGESLTAGQLGVTEELKQLLAGNSLTVQAGEVPITDLDKHALELYRGTAISETPISLRKTTARVVQRWMPGAQPPTNLPWAPAESLSRLFPFARADIQSGEVLTARGDFEERCERHFAVYFANQENLDLRITLPKGCCLTGRFYSQAKDIQSTGYAELPQAVKDQIWQTACSMAQRDVQQLRKDALDGHSKSQATSTSALPPP